MISRITTIICLDKKYDMKASLPKTGYSWENIIYKQNKSKALDRMVDVLNDLFKVTLMSSVCLHIPIDTCRRKKISAHFIALYFRCLKDNYSRTIVGIFFESNKYEAQENIKITCGPIMRRELINCGGIAYVEI